MAKELTFSIIKPNAMKKGVIGDVIETFEKNGLKIAAAKISVISKEKCQQIFSKRYGKIAITAI